MEGFLSIFLFWFKVFGGLALSKTDTVPFLSKPDITLSSLQSLHGSGVCLLINDVKLEYLCPNKLPGIISLIETCSVGCGRYLSLDWCLNASASVCPRLCSPFAHISPPAPTFTFRTYRLSGAYVQLLPELVRHPWQLSTFALASDPRQAPSKRCASATCLRCHLRSFQPSTSLASSATTAAGFHLLSLPRYNLLSILHCCSCLQPTFSL